MKINTYLSTSLSHHALIPSSAFCNLQQVSSLFVSHFVYNYDTNKAGKPVAPLNH